MTRIEPGGRATRAYRRVQTAATVASATVERTPAVTGIVLAELPPHVRDAFADLLAETDELRRTLALARARIEELERLVETDELTPVANRRGLLRDLARTLAEVERHGLGAALIFVDVDRLKAINDAHGHGAGDAALVHVAETLRASVRESDTSARMGGDEFAVILRHVDAAQAAAKTAQIMAAVAARPLALGGATVAVTVSAGCHVLVPGDTAVAVLALADRAMYARKMARR
jgi:diguanylate cyclase (GGDEF)-like protein